MLTLQSSLYSFLLDRDQRYLVLAVVRVIATLSPLWFVLWILWRLRWGGGSVGKGLRLQNAGRPAEAEPCYRRALARSILSASKRAQLLRCLGDALMDMGRYDESRQCLDEALAMGDPTGSCRSSIAELLLLQGIEPEKALDMADKALEASTTGLEWTASSKERVGRDLVSVVRATIWGQRAWALALLGRREQSHQAIDSALQFMLQPSADLLQNFYGVGRIARMGEADTYWLTGMALLAMNEIEGASEHFQKGSNADRKGKYGARCRKQLALVKMPVG